MSVDFSVGLYGLIAIAATAMVITRARPVHALLYMVVALLALACLFDSLGAPFAAMLDVIVYAGAIMVLFVFVVMMINLGQPDETRERSWITPSNWFGPSVLAALLLTTLIFALGHGDAPTGPNITEVGPTAVGMSLFGPYMLTVELASFLLLAGLVSAFHIGRALGEKR
jgi:NADH-quinone oxidoreductase subunit J